MNFNEAYNYLVSLQNLPRKEYMADPRHCGVYIQRLQFFLDILGNPEKKIPHYIHVAGTSGKGSTVSFIHSILKESGMKVGSTQSPHPTSITERWKIDNQYMSKKEFIELVKYIKPKLDIYTRTTPYDNLSFFEVVEAIGFVHFARKKAKWVVLEAGCGGRYDSSNVVPHKDIAIITNIGLDHKGIIGKNKQEIAYEKAGIIQHNSYVLSGERNKKIREVIGKEAKKKNCKIEYADDGYEIQKHSLNGISFRHKNKDYSLAVLGEHQIQNAILAIQAAEHLKIKEKDIKNGLKKTRLPLRMEVVSKNPLIILDSAHNPDKIKSTVNTINQINLENINLIVGFSEDKEVDKMVKQLSTLNLKTIACTRYIKNPLRLTADPKTLGSKSKKLLPKRKIEIFLDPQTAMQWTRTKTKTNDLILVTGSIFLAGELISR